MITNTDTINETTVPTPNTSNSKLFNAKPSLAILSKLAPNITGMAKKNVNSAAISQDIPINKAPTIVAPERDVPGKTAAITWNIPIIRAILYVT